MCISIPPFPTCGVHGSCEVNTSSCVCVDDGWTQSTEMYFFLEDSSFEEKLPCDNNNSVLHFLYTMNFLVSFVSLIFHIWVTKNRRKVFKRLIPTFIYLFLSTLSAFIRIIDMNRVLGQDPLFNTMVFISTFPFDIATVFFFSQYVRHIVLNRFPLLEKLAEPRFKVINLFSIICYFLAVAILIEGLSFPFVSFPVANKLFRHMCAQRLVISAIYTFCIFYIFGFLHSDIKSILEGKKYETDLDMETTIKLRRLLPVLNGNKHKVLLAQMILAPVWALPLASRFGYTIIKYWIPFLQTAWALFTLIVIQNQVRYILNRRKKFAKVVDVKDLLK
mmetsp:Transcript_22761/g.29044  ORF Transcript_22761/g.29044 Transcript_22761/m.29044 type:complete len:333 (+) Transcript_22761:75-1073(+)